MAQRFLNAFFMTLGIVVVLYSIGMWVVPTLLAKLISFLPYKGSAIEMTWVACLGLGAGWFLMVAGIARQWLYPIRPIAKQRVWAVGAGLVQLLTGWVVWLLLMERMLNSEGPYAMFFMVPILSLLAGLCGGMVASLFPALRS